MYRTCAQHTFAGKLVLGSSYRHYFLSLYWGYFCLIVIMACLASFLKSTEVGRKFLPEKINDQVIPSE